MPSECSEFDAVGDFFWCNRAEIGTAPANVGIDYLTLRRRYVRKRSGPRATRKRWLVSKPCS